MRGLGRAQFDLSFAEGEIIPVVSMSRATVSMTMLLVSWPIRLFAGGIPVYAPNPVGEKLYRAYISRQMLPVFVLFLGWAVGAVVHRLLQRPRKPEAPKWSPAIRFM